MNLPNGIEINNLVYSLRNFCWEAADIMIYYSQKLRDPEYKRNIIKNNNSDDPVTLADLEVNQIIIKRINENYKHISWDILSEENVKNELNKSFDNLNWLWVLDPIDGTKDFIQGTENYAMHLALNYKEKPILGTVLIPERNELWISSGDKFFCENREKIRKEFNISRKTNLNEMTLVMSKNHRNEKLEELIHKVNFKKVKVMGSIGCKISSILRGESDIYITLSMPGESSPKDWDLAAPEAILKAAGGAITNLNNQTLKYKTETLQHPGIIIASNNRETHPKICSQIKEIIKKYNIYPISS